MTESPIGERLARLETMAGTQGKQLERIEGKMDVFADALAEARGSKKTMLAMGGIGGSIGGVIMSKLWPLLTTLPK